MGLSLSSLRLIGIHHYRSPLLVVKGIHNQQRTGTLNYAKTTGNQSNFSLSSLAAGLRRFLTCHIVDHQPLTYHLLSRYGIISLHISKLIGASNKFINLRTLAIFVKSRHRSGLRKSVGKLLCTIATVRTWIRRIRHSIETGGCWEHLPPLL